MSQSNIAEKNTHGKFQRKETQPIRRLSAAGKQGIQRVRGLVMNPERIEGECGEADCFIRIDRPV